MKIAIVGLGLIGGSLGRAILKKTKNTVFGWDIDETAMLKGELMGAYSERLDDENIKDIDMLIVALSPKSAIAAMQKYCPKLKDGAIVIDTCGNKRIITDAMQLLYLDYPTLRFQGVHPMAGREFSGISHSMATLFENAYIIIVPVVNDLDALSTVKSLFLELGAADAEICSAKKHDELIAYTSQLAHIVSSSYIKNEHSSEHAGFSAGSFRDMTRVAKLSPGLWTELFLENRDNLLSDIDVLLMHLNEYKSALENEDEKMLYNLLADGVALKEQAENARKERNK